MSSPGPVCPRAHAPASPPHSVSWPSRVPLSSFITPLRVPSRCLSMYIGPCPTTQQVRAPDKHIAREVGRIVRRLAGTMSRRRRPDQVLLRSMAASASLTICSGLRLSCGAGSQPMRSAGCCSPACVAGCWFLSRSVIASSCNPPSRGATGAVVIKTRWSSSGGRRLQSRAKGQRQPTGLRTQVFLAPHSAPSRHRFDAAAHHQQIDQAAVVHVHVVPVVHRRPRIIIDLPRVLLAVSQIPAPPE